ncbi:retrotransposon protein, putative, ty1-copia subclass [Tanacetum coccineum]
MTTLNSKEIKEKYKENGDNGEGLYVRRKTDRRDSHQSKGKPRSKSRGGRLKCYILQSDDHLKRNSPKNNRKKSIGYVKKDDQPSSSGSTYDDSEVMMVMSAEALLDWIMDSGCSYHMTPRLDIFFDFLECDGGSVLLGDNRECNIRGIGKVRVQLRDGLSASVEEKDNLAHVWHKILGHISKVGLQVLENQGMFGKKSLCKLDFCENYVLGNSHRVSFGVERHTTQGVIDYVHSDLWGLSQVESLGVEAVSRELNWEEVKKLRTDNGLEFCNREFEQLCIESRIARHLTVSTTLQENGLVERMNGTLMDKVHCLLIQSGLPKTFWAEATCTATYLINRSPSTTIVKKTPMEMWSGHPSDYGMLRIFDCVAYSHVKQGKQRAGLNNHTLEEDQTDKDAMKEDIDSLRKNKTWELVDHLVGQKLVSCKWLVKIKERIEGVQKPRYKARLMARGFTQREDYELEQLDVKTTILHGNLEEVIYMRQPSRYEQGNKVCLLKKSLYGLKQSPRQCIGDDMLIAYKSKAEIGSTKSLLMKEFDMKDLEEAKKILGMEIVKDQSRKILRVSQSGTSKVLYANAIESLMYSMVCMKPDIAYAGTANVGLVYGTNRGNCVDVTVHGCVVSWKATLQHVVALLTTEAEYMTLTEAVKEAIWLRGLLEELGVELNTVAVNCDNQGAIHLSLNHAFHERTKHINVCYHFIREVLEAKTVKVLKVGTKHNVVATLTKVVPGRK